VFRAALFDDMVPCWLRHTPDHQQGGFFTWLARDGTRYPDDKDMWMTDRAIRMFSHLYNRQFHLHADDMCRITVARCGAVRRPKTDGTAIRAH
jgi:mannose/cellobiose epimerase-like protein (N-acyl-D-glucosamine 2-epimerase family)